MDRLIKRFDSVKDGDLRVAAHRGIAYQKDMTVGRVPYDADYLAKVKAYEDTPVARAVNAGRCALIERHAEAGARVLDIGAGSGAFMRELARRGFSARGFDVIPEVARELRDAGLFADDPFAFDAVTLWDCIEHLEDPEIRLQAVRKEALLFASLPIFGDVSRVRESKHYRPGEHLYYWTRDGFVDWMALYGFRLLEESAHEVEAGRESIGAFAFRRDLPDYHDHVAAYQQMHAERFYGSSATELHLPLVAKIVKHVRPTSILDYGCGRSDLVAHFWLDGKRRIARYDPAIGAFKNLPGGRFDLALCCDVLEHVPMAHIDRVLHEIRARSDRAFFTVSTKPARAKLPDGRNAHVTLLTPTEWARWIASAFGGRLQTLPSQWEHELLFVAGLDQAIPK